MRLGYRIPHLDPFCATMVIYRERHKAVVILRPTTKSTNQRIMSSLRRRLAVKKRLMGEVLAPTIRLCCWWTVRTTTVTVNYLPTTAMEPSTKVFEDHPKVLGSTLCHGPFQPTISIVQLLLLWLDVHLWWIKMRLPISHPTMMMMPIGPPAKRRGVLPVTRVFRLGVRCNVRGEQTHRDANRWEQLLKPWMMNWLEILAVSRMGWW